MKSITAKEAERLATKLNIDASGDGRTYYATNNAESELYEFDTKAERDSFVKRNAMA